MARPRNTANAHLPKHMHHKNGAYFYVRDGKWNRLGVTLADAYTALGRLLGGTTAGTGSDAPAQATPAADDKSIRVVDLLMRCKPLILKDVRPNTVSNYKASINLLAEAFDSLQLSALRPKHVLAIRRKLSGSPSTFNSALTVLRKCMDYALEQEHIELNPIAGIKQMPQRKRTRYLEHGEYLSIYHAGSERLQITMELCYRTGQRIRDVLGIERTHCTDDGVNFRQRKSRKENQKGSGKKVCIGWSPELTHVVGRAMAFNPEASADNPYLLRSRGKRCFGYMTIYVDWVKACAIAKVEDAGIHDIRAKSATDTKNAGGEAGLLKAQVLMGHSTPGMTIRYIRDRQADDAVGPSETVIERRTKKVAVLSMADLERKGEVTEMKPKAKRRAA